MTIGFNEIQVESRPKGRFIKLVVKRKLDKEDYEEFVPQLEWLIEKNGTINLLVELVDFQGWTVGALWEDTKFALKHFADIGKLAIVGDGKQWEKGMTTFIKPFTKAQLKYFESHDKKEAENWMIS